MSKKQTERIAELEARCFAYEEIIRKSNFSALVPEREQIGFSPNKNGSEK